MSKNAQGAIASSTCRGGRATSGFDRELAMGAHLASSRVGYSHHGIYVGGGNVVHYAGSCRCWRAGSIEEVTLAGFAVGHGVRIIYHPDARYSPQQVIDRARSRLGEHDYHLLTNNCEHFCSWCITGFSRSTQIERPLVLAFRVALARPVSFVSRLDATTFQRTDATPFPS